MYRFKTLYTEFKRFRPTGVVGISTEALRGMQRLGNVPDLRPYNALTKACENGDQLAPALELLKNLQPPGVVLDAITYNALVSACKKGKQPGRALDLFEIM